MQDANAPQGALLVDRAMIFCIAAHQAIGQKRKYTGEPYYRHPFNVAAIVQSVPHSSSMVAAAYLHDVIEDTGISELEVRECFTPTIFNLVKELTNVVPKSAGNRAKRFEIEKARIATISPRAKTVKLADLLDNTSTIVKHDPSFAKVYMREKASLLDVLREGDADLWSRAQEVCNNYFDGKQTNK